MAEGTTTIDTALTTEGDADGTDLIVFGVGSLDPGPSPSGPLQYIRDHEEAAARKLAPPFWGKPFANAVLLAFMREIQTLEDTLWEMLELRTLAGADLPRLKVLGKIVGQPRLGFSTENYRLLIEARALANVSKGEARDLLAVLNLLLGQGEYTLLAMGNATLWLTALQPVDAEGLSMIAQILPDTRAAGVALQFLFTTGGSFADVFVWGDLWGAPETWGSVRIL